MYQQRKVSDKKNIKIATSKGGKQLYQKILGTLACQSNYHSWQFVVTLKCPLVKDKRSRKEVEEW